MSIETFTEADLDRIARSLAQMLDSSEDPDVVLAAVRAVEEEELVAATESVARHAGDADADVRQAVARALGALRSDAGDPEHVVQALLRLARDPVDDVRDWALFGLGQGGGMPIDTPQMRAVFAENATHLHDGVRAESIRALAQLGDVEMLEKALSTYEFDHELVEAARRVGDPRLHPALLELLAEERSVTETWEYVRDDLLAAIAACEPSS